HRRHPVRRAGRLRPPARPRPRPGRRPRRHQDPGLPRPARRNLRRGRLRRDGRARRRHPVPAVLRHAVPQAQAGRPPAHPADVPPRASPRRRPLHRVLHRPGHEHAPGRRHHHADRAGRVRGHRCPGHARALRAHHPGLGGELRAQPARHHRDPDLRTGPRLASLPGRGRARLRGRADGRRPDPGHEADEASGACTMSGLAPGPFVITMVVTAAALLLLQGLTFAVALKLGKHSVVDTAWGIGIALAALTAFLTSINHGQNERRYLLLAASLLWGLRLAAYVGWRNHGQPEDPRYQDMLNRATGSRNLYALRMIYLLQAAILWLASVPVQAGMLERAPAGALAIIGAV